MRRMAFTASALAAMFFLSRASAQQVRTALSADTIRVGDVVAVGLQIDLPRGAELVLPDTLELSGDLENAARKRTRLDSLPGGALRHLVTYPITAWKPGSWPLPAITVTVRGSAGDTAGAQVGSQLARSMTVQLPVVQVISVLPADTAGLEARPPRDVWGASRVWWPLALLALLVLVLVGALIWWWRRRPVSVAAQPAAPALPPREWALRELARIRDAHWLERGEYRRFYIELSDTLRRYASLLDDAWSADLTTRELSACMRQSSIDPGALSALLERADLVKFARYEPGRDPAREDLETASHWVETFEMPAAFAEAA